MVPVRVWLAIICVDELTVKLEELVAIPPGVVTAMVPVVAPEGTVAVTEVALTTANVAAAMLLNLTPVMPVRFVPVMVTEVPTEPEMGVNDVIVGALAGAAASPPPPPPQLINIKHNAK